MSLSLWNDPFFSTVFRSPFPARSELAKWQPAVDVKENDKEVTLKAELPGVKKVSSSGTARD